MGDHCDLQNGFAFDGSRFSRTKGTPLIRIRDLKTNCPSEKYDGAYDPSILVPPGSLLVGMDGEFRCYRWQGPEALLNQRVCRLLPKIESLSPDFLFFGLNDYLREIEKQTAYTTVKHISSKQILGMQILIPSLSEQHRIAAILTEQMAHVDRARAAAESQLEATKVLSKAYVRLAFKGITPLSAGQERDMEPPGWKWKRLTTLAKLESGHTPSRYHPEWWGGTIPWIALPDIRNLDGKTALETSEYTNEGGIANSSARILPEGTVVLSRTASVGFVAVMGRPMATSQDFVNWVCGPELDPLFLASLLRASRDYIRSLSSGAVHQTVYMPTVKAFDVCVPSLSEQKVIAENLVRRLSSVEQTQRSLQDQLDAINAFPAALLRQAFSGGL